LAEFRAQGFKLVDNTLEFDALSKESIRKLNRHAVQFLVEKNKELIEKYEGKFIKTYIIDGKSLNPNRIEPRIVKVENEYFATLFRWVKLHWSIPISAGYGRRLRYIVFDRTSGSVIGIIGLADPVYLLTDRDNLIGWSRKQQSKRLKHLMDAFVLGAVPPYSMILGGKLVASLVASKEIYDDFKSQYGGKKSVIRGERFDGTLAAVTTTSAFGRSSMYDRIRIPSGPEFIHVGWTRGYGEFHFMNGMYHRLSGMVKSSGYTGKNKKWGTGVRSRRAVVQKALVMLGLPKKLQFHGIQREIFMTPLGHNWQAFLQGKTKRFRPYGMYVTEISDYMIKRWVVPRSERDKSFLTFKPEAYSVSP
jgi:hypothetical protein